MIDQDPSPWYLSRCHPGRLRLENRIDRRNFPEAPKRILNISRRSRPNKLLQSIRTTRLQVSPRVAFFHISRTFEFHGQEYRHNGMPTRGKRGNVTSYSTTRNIRSNYYYYCYCYYYFPIVTSSLCSPSNLSIMGKMTYIFPCPFRFLFSSYFPSTTSVK